MLKRILFAVFLMMLALPVTAQDQSGDQDEKKVGPLERIVADILQRSIADETDYLFNTRPLFEAGRFSFIMTPDQNKGYKLSIDSPDIPMPRMSFSFTLPNPYIGSPAYEVTGVVRTSLSQDPVTGKYWWEW